MLNKIPRLSASEEAVMLILWKADKAFLKDIVQAFPAPQPSQSTISTLLRTLERKGLVTHRAYSKTFEYSPVVPKQVFLKAWFGDFFGKYLDGSFEDLIRFIQQELDVELRLPPAEKAEDEELQAKQEEVDLRQMSLFG